MPRVVGFISGITNKEILIFATREMYLNNRTLSDKSQTKVIGYMYYIFSLSLSQILNKSNLGRNGLFG